MNDDFEQLLAECKQQMEANGYSNIYMNKLDFPDRFMSTVYL